MTLWLIAYCIACVFGAAIVRGYSGFGFSLLAITSMSLVLPPAEIIPSVFMMEVAASLGLLPSIWKDIHWRALALFWVGGSFCPPLWGLVLALVPFGAHEIPLGRDG